VCMLRHLMAVPKTTINDVLGNLECRQLVGLFLCFQMLAYSYVFKCKYECNSLLS
jgi:hypothetical protein